MFIFLKCHAVLSYLIGMQDISLALRETLKNFMNNLDYTTELKFRWVSYRKASDQANSIQIDDKILDTEWSEIISMKSANEHNNSIANESANSCGLDKSGSTILTSESHNLSKSQMSTSSHQSLIYLEDIHIFALANLLYRTIIVVSLDTIRNIQPIHLRGIYLPLMRKAEECVKDPILIAFHNFHFMPLLFPVDDDSGSIKEDQTNEFASTEKYFHFENIDEMELRDLDNTEYENFFKFNLSAPLTTSKSNATNNTATNSNGQMSNSCLVSPSGLNVKRKKNRFHNTLPLYYYNLEPMKIHFLTDQEEKKENNHWLGKYLNLIQLDIVIDDLHASHVDFLNENKTITVLCCYLQKDSRNKRIRNDGISTYLNFLNESIKKNGYRVAASPRNDESISPSRFGQVTSPPVADTPASMIMGNSESISPIPTSPKLCRSDNCNEKALELPTSYGYCLKCFKNKQLTQSTPTSPNPYHYAQNNSAESTNRLKKELEAEKETQQTQFVAASSSGFSETDKESQINTSELHINRSKANIANSSSTKTFEVIRKSSAQQPHQPASRTKLELCSTKMCNNVVQSLNENLCVSCKQTCIADAMRTNTSASAGGIKTTADFLSKTTDRNISTSRTSSNTKVPIQIPVRHDQPPPPPILIQNNMSNSKISAYNLTNDSKLYKTQSLVKQDEYGPHYISSNSNKQITPKVNNINAYLDDEYDNTNSSRYLLAQSDQQRRTHLVSIPQQQLTDPFSNYPARNVSFQKCSNCKYPILDRTGASSFCNNCRMSPYSKLYF